jgi:hypothetical protein
MMIVSVSRNKDSRRMCFAHRRAALCFRARDTIEVFDIEPFTLCTHRASIDGAQGIDDTRQRRAAY